MRLRLLIVLLFAMAALAPGPRVAAQDAPISTAIVPIAGSVYGATMVRWKTDVELVNDTGAAADVAIEFPNAPEQPVIFLSLAPGQRQVFTDIGAEAFGTESILSPLRVTTSGRRSVTVRATVHAERGGERYPEQPLTTYFGVQDAAVRILDGVAFSEEFRTNVGIANFGEQAAEFVLALQRIPGRNLAVTRVVLGPGALYHNSIQSMFPLITDGAGFSVVIESVARNTYVWASVIRSEDHAGQFISPRLAVR